jgi:mannosyl-3-phosphoglycerate phosphatase
MLEYLVFTDLDGTLLNHNDYSFHEATEAIEYLKNNKIPLIIVTSKTFSEVRILQDKLDIQCPFIVENGAGIYIPPDSILTKSMPKQNRYVKISKAQSYLELRLFFKTLQNKHDIRGFGDMDKDEVIKLTGLDELSALNAMKRDFTEPFIVGKNVDVKAIKKQANIVGLDIVKGGRFYHLISKDQDKAQAMKHLTHLYEECFDKDLKMIALGDSANDFTMLKAADIGVLIQLHNGKFANIDAKDILKTSYPGPKGWNKALLEILNV